MSAQPPTILLYWSKSKDQAPGKGAGETLGCGDFKELAGIPNWRKVLSAFYVTAKPLEYNGRQYASREHAYHAAKVHHLVPFRALTVHLQFPEHPEYQRLFEYDSKSVFARDPALAKSAGGKTGVVRQTVEGKKKVVFKRSLRVRADPTVLAKVEDVMEAIMLCEFRQDPLARRVLLATRDAVLTHNDGRGAKTVTEHGLMRVRAVIRKEVV